MPSHGVAQQPNYHFWPSAYGDTTIVYTQTLIVLYVCVQMWKCEKTKKLVRCQPFDNERRRRRGRSQLCLAVSFQKLDTLLPQTVSLFFNIKLSIFLSRPSPFWHWEDEERGNEGWALFGHFYS